MPLRGSCCVPVASNVSPHETSAHGSRKLLLLGSAVRSWRALLLALVGFLKQHGVRRLQRNLFTFCGERTVPATTSRRVARSCQFLARCCPGGWRAEGTRVKHRLSCRANKSAQRRWPTATPGLQRYAL